MKRKLACRATLLWPDVIADLISQYAELTTREKVTRLANMGDPALGSPIMLTDYVAMRRLHMDGISGMCVYMDKWSSFIQLDDLADAIDAKKWPPGFKYEMTSAMISALDKWLSRADD